MMIKNQIPIVSRLFFLFSIRAGQIRIVNNNLLNKLVLLINFIPSSFILIIFFFYSKILDLVNYSRLKNLNFFLFNKNISNNKFNR